MPSDLVLIPFAPFAALQRHRRSGRLDPADRWDERWILEYDNIHIPVEIYLGRRRPAGDASSRLILPGFGGAEPIHVAVRLGLDRPA